MGGEPIRKSVRVLVIQLDPRRRAPSFDYDLLFPNAITAEHLILVRSVARLSHALVHVSQRQHPRALLALLTIMVLPVHVNIAYPFVRIARGVSNFPLYLLNKDRKVPRKFLLRLLFILQYFQGLVPLAVDYVVKFLEVEVVVRRTAI